MLAEITPSSMEMRVSVSPSIPVVGPSIVTTSLLPSAAWTSTPGMFFRRSQMSSLHAGSATTTALEMWAEHDLPHPDEEPVATHDANSDNGPDAEGEDQEGQQFPSAFCPARLAPIRN
jgi:hypothetical protein